MTYVVLDTNILVSALWRHLLQGRPAQLLDLCLSGHYSVIYTQAILEEYETVLARPKFGFAPEDVKGLLDYFEFRALRGEPIFESLARPKCSDPDDQKFYDVACCCDAILVTGNKKHFPEDPRVLSPAEFFAGRM